MCAFLTSCGSCGTCFGRRILGFVTIYKRGTDSVVYMSLAMTSQKVPFDVLPMSDFERSADMEPLQIPTNVEDRRKQLISFKGYFSCGEISF
ncbi:hypothetical protein M011DRAFT_140524 [Sporormia fimetaria CBS 119925]|uniref:Uncharacterized protein n=1 Tax=Sporormia fimetaria CBS 119925 TaxID=1340428 RepID=A0A6A6V589_9PLEO|nr:hypothetical protein M011DRAFT_140524 [Sporormia fimetaria CBS 119925]